MTDVFDEQIVLSSQPNYPALTPIESRAVAHIRRRAKRHRSAHPSAPQPVPWVWSIALALLMAVRPVIRCLEHTILLH